MNDQQEITKALRDFFDAPYAVQEDVLAMRPDLRERLTKHVRDWLAAAPTSVTDRKYASEAQEQAPVLD